MKGKRKSKSLQKFILSDVETKYSQFTVIIQLQKLYLLQA